MDLFLCAQDIQFVRLGLVVGEKVVAEKTVDVPPEQYLRSLDTFLTEQNVALHDIQRLMVVTGPGSFTASRVSVTMANTIAYVQGIPMIAIENPDRKSLTELIPLIAHAPEHRFVVPVYDRPPHIT